VVNSTTHQANRTAISDVNVTTGGRLETLSTSYTNVTVQAHFGHSGVPNGTLRYGLLARYVDVNNWFAAWLETTSGNASFNIGVAKVIGGSGSGIGAATWSYGDVLRLGVDATGRWWVMVFANGTNPSEPILAGYDAALGTGGTLASGKCGIADWYTGSAAVTRLVDDYLTFVPTADAAIFGTQSLTLGSSYATREDSGGTFSTTISDRRGHYLKIPPSGPEGRSTRLAVLALPNDPYTASDVAAIYDTSAQLFVTPRGLVVPEA
jgi:hypothetical protein